MFLVLDSSLQPTQRSDNFSTTYSDPIKLNGNDGSLVDYEIALFNAYLWYSWFNISSEYSNNTLKYYNGALWRTVTFPNGSYQLDDINDYLQSVMKVNGDSTTVDGIDMFNLSIQPNYSTLRTKLVISGSYKFDFSVGNLFELLGVNADIYTVSSEGTDLVDITRGVNSIHIHCSIVDGSFVNGAASDVIHTFNPQKPPGNLIDIQPNYPIYLKVKAVRQIPSITMKVTDQLGRPLNLNGETTSFTLHLREAQSAI